MTAQMIIRCVLATAIRRRKIPILNLSAMHVKRYAVLVIFKERGSVSYCISSLSRVVSTTEHENRDELTQIRKVRRRKFTLDEPDESTNERDCQCQCQSHRIRVDRAVAPPQNDLLAVLTTETPRV